MPRVSRKCAAKRAARTGEGTNPRDAALAKFARQLTEQRGVIADADLSAFKPAGFDDGIAIEVVALVALNTLTN
jgi:alkylhydroperoxidase family enzyme